MGGITDPGKQAFMRHCLILSTLISDRMRRERKNHRKSGIQLTFSASLTMGKLRDHILTAEIVLYRF